MLIDSPRLSGPDRAAWDRLAAFDQTLATDPRLERRETAAAEMIARWAANNDGGYIGVSWGKDSVVAAHLAITAGFDLPLVWVRVDQWENPDCPAVRDAFLARHPGVDYHEITVAATAPRRWETATQGTARTSSAGFADAAAQFGDRYVSGIRAEESSTRRMSAMTHGATTARTCRPILRWTGIDVFVYLARHDLPVHPAYAMTYGGQLDRTRIRVGSLGGERGTGQGRAQWERHYYPEIVGDR